MSKMEDEYGWGPRPVPDEDDPYMELFEGLTPDEAIQLQREIDEAERS